MDWTLLFDQLEINPLVDLLMSRNPRFFPLIVGVALAGVAIYVFSLMLERPSNRPSDEPPNPNVVQGDDPLDHSAGNAAQGANHVAVNPVTIATTATARRETKDRELLSAEKDGWVSEHFAELAGKQLKALLATAVDGIITIDERGIIEDANPAAERLFGYSVQQMVGSNVSMLMPSPYSDEHDGYMARYLETGQRRIIGIGREVIGRRKDGSTFPIGLSVSEVDHLGLFTGIVQDISDRRNLQKQVLEIAAEEDRRIGHELHDNIQQQLTGLGLLAQSQAEALTQASSPQADMAARLAKGIREAANHVHLLSRGLVPVEVDAEGLRSALTDLASKVSEQYSVRCDFQCVGSVNRLDNFSATHLYRIAQEAINNAIKHGRAKQIKMSLTGDDENIMLKVLDNGIGIDDKPAPGPGMGLRIMDYRAGLIGATVRVAPAKDGGTLVNCTISRGGGNLR